jgi:hypothetical protein
VLIVTANDTNRLAGQPNPTLTGTLAGLQNSDAITATYQCSATASSPAGTYDIVPVLDDPDSKLGNYNVTLHNGTLTVKQVNVVINIPTLAGQTLTFTVPTVVGSTYVLEYQDSLADTSWTVAQTVPGTGDVVAFTDSTTGSAARFYRIRVE